MITIKIIFLNSSDSLLTIGGLYALYCFCVENLAEDFPGAF